MYLEHPSITEMNRKGYLGEETESCGSDIYGDEIRSGDDYVEYDGELILLENLQRYLSEHLDFEFKTAE